MLGEMTWRKCPGGPMAYNPMANNRCMSASPGGFGERGRATWLSNTREGCSVRQNARTAGDWRIIARHVNLNCRAPHIVPATANLGYAIVAEARAFQSNSIHCRPLILSLSKDAGSSRFKPLRSKPLMVSLSNHERLGINFAKAMGRGRAQLPWLRDSAGHSTVGREAFLRSPPVRRGFAVAGGTPQHCGVRDQPVGRLPERCPGSRVGLVLVLRVSTGIHVAGPRRSRARLSCPRAVRPSPARPETIRGAISKQALPGFSPSCATGAEAASRPAIEELP